MNQLGEKEFDSAVANGTVLVDFGAEWCGPCKVMEPVLEKIAEAYRDKLTVYAVDIDQDPSLAARHGVMSVPTMLVMKGGQPVERIVGAISEKSLREKIEPHLGS